MPRLPSPKNLRSGIKKSPMDMTTSYRVGWFGHIMYNEDYGWTPVIQWTHCRDIFQDASNHALNTKGMWFCHSLGVEESLCAFIQRLEEKLGIKERSYFMRTPEPNVIWIKPSPFWVNDFVRRSFFTLALRCGMHYKRTKDNFEQVLCEHYKIARETVPAIKRFLKGYTFYPYEEPEFNTMGWNYLFYNCDGPRLEKLLVKE